MAYEPKPGDVSIFRNVSNNERAPTMKGYAVAHRDIRAGEKLDLAVWKQTPKNGGDSFFSGKLSDPYQQSDSPPPQSDNGRDDWLS
jgi:uncharacterized protein (DUF736 family)